MIQRIQTIYLLFAALSSASTLLFPFFSGAAANSSFLADGLYNTNDHIALIGIVTIAILDALMTIFLFKNRKQQALFALATALANLLIIVFMLGILSTQIDLTNLFSTLSLGIGSLTPLVGTLAALLARRSILADEALVKSMDRLR